MSNRQAEVTAVPAFWALPEAGAAEAMRQMDSQVVQAAREVLAQVEEEAGAVVTYACPALLLTTAAAAVVAVEMANLEV